MMDDDRTDLPQADAAPEPEKVKCEQCGRFVEVEEITTLRGKFYCPDCVADTVSIEGLLPFREKYDNRAIRWTVLGCGLAVLVVVVGAVFMLVYTYIRLGPMIECRNLQLPRLYKALSVYASSHNAYPPDNNDLRPLYGTGYRTSLSNFVCPGTKNIVTSVAQLKDDSTSPEGPGMSYFYQGGLRFFGSEGDERPPLLWDQSPANHRNRGVNIIYKDGHHAWHKRAPELVRPGEPAVDATAH